MLKPRSGGPLAGLAFLVASFGYAGASPVAPGTAGSAAAILLYGLLHRAGLGWLDPWVTISLFLLGVWAATAVARELGTPDPGLVVIDEVVGMFVTLSFLPVGIIGVVVGFLLFRVFDIIKPFPAAQSESLPGGLGIMMDDVFAGVYAHLVLRGLAWLAPAWFLA